MKINLDTYDGSGQTCHPSVINIGKIWNGYRYWMANTPLPYGSNIYENPSIWASNDGEHFEVPKGLTNPIVPKPEQEGGFNADSELFFDNDRLYLVWKEEILGSRLTKICSTADSILWDVPKIILPEGLDDTEKVSPSLIKIGDRYYCYYYSHLTNTTRRVSCDTVDGVYSDVEIVNLPPAGDGYIWWHFDIINLKGLYWLSAVRTKGAEVGDEIHILAGYDGINFHWFKTLVVSGETGIGLYRPTLVMIERKPALYYGRNVLIEGKEIWSCERIKIDSLW